MATIASRTVPSRWPLLGLLAAALTAAVLFWVVAALPYLSLDPARFGVPEQMYWPRRYGLLPHIAGGTLALLIGPVQIWLGETRSKLAWHRVLGSLYLLGVTVGALGAYYLALTTPGPFAFATGLFGLAVAWTVTTGMAYRAIRARAIDQHREWMIRSYVVTLAFVIFRALDTILTARGVGVVDSISFAAWACWAVPLLLLEPCLQWRKLRAPR
jgi:uncharacterized membrane protein